MVKAATLTNIMGVPDTYAWNSGSLGAIGLRQVMSSEYPELANTLCRLEGTILSSTQDASGNWYGEVDIAIFDIATDRAIAKIKVGASKGIAGWDIINASVNKTDNPILTNLQQTDEGFESTPLDVKDVVVKGVNPGPIGPFPSSGERVAVGLSESESVDLLSMAYDAISGVDITQGITNNYNVQESTPGETSYERKVESEVSYGSTLQNGQSIDVTDSHHTRNGGSSSFAKYRTVESQGCVTSTYIPLNFGSEPFTYSTIAYNSESTPGAFVTHTLGPLDSNSNDIPRGVISVNTELPHVAALFTSKNLNMSWATVDQQIEK